MWFDVGNKNRGILQFLELDSKEIIIPERVFNAYAVIRDPISKRVIHSKTITKIANKILPVIDKRILKEKNFV